MSISVKRGDNVVVIAGKDKGKTGKVLEVFPEENRVLVDGVNIVTKHKKARSAQEQSGRIQKTAPIDASNVMVVCPTCGKATRIHHKEVDGKKVRVCKCGVSLDKEYVKQSKKDAKKAKAEKPVKETKAAAPKADKNAKVATKATQTAAKAEKTASKKAETQKSKTSKKDA